MIQVKQGVKLDKLQPQALFILVVAKDVYAKHGVDLVWTSGNDGKHSPKSLHYKGKAVDLRTFNIPSSRVTQQILAELREALGENFDVVLESDHIHAEYDPKGGKNVTA